MKFNIVVLYGREQELLNANDLLLKSITKNITTEECAVIVDRYVLSIEIIVQLYVLAISIKL